MSSLHDVYHKLYDSSHPNSRPIIFQGALRATICHKRFSLENLRNVLEKQIANFFLMYTPPTTFLYVQSENSGEKAQIQIVVIVWTIFATLRHF